MSSSITNSELSIQLENIISDFIKEKIELIMKEEINNFLKVERPDLEDSKNGYYHRSLDTRYGRIENLTVPRDRMGEFQTQVFEPYQRRDGWLEDAIIKMYQSGMSTREIGKFIEKILGSSYSPTTVSNITNIVLEDIEQWQKRTLNKRYSVLYLDGIYTKVRRDVVAKEVIYLVVGVNEDGFREVLGFYVGGNESSLGWQEILQDLYKRGLKEILLGVFDGLAGLEEAFKSVYPKADVQRCVVHKVRNTLNHARKKDQAEIAEDLKTVYRSNTMQEALNQFEQFREKWNKRYPKEVQSWDNDLSVLLTFLNYPTSIRSVIYTTNWIERTNKDIRKRLRPMNSLPDIKAVEKIVYLTIQNLNADYKLCLNNDMRANSPKYFF
ncbi:IS256 family transposase [Tepidibacillus infernus]